MATTAQKPVAAATPASVTVVSISSAEPNPKKTVTSSPDKSDPPTTAEGTVKGIEDSKTTETHLGSVVGESSGPGNDIQKKMRRAERFGVPAQLSEQEKRDSRAERFGIGPGSKGSEEVKRKARAERFGLAVPSTAVDEDEEEKKKARLARFAPYAKPDTREGEKRKARAIRFSNPLSSSLAQVNIKGNIEPEAPIAGKAGGSL